MGGSISNLFAGAFGKKKTQIGIFVVGLHGAGKTSILHKLKLGYIDRTVPHIGPMVETVVYRNVKFTSVDVGGEDGMHSTDCYQGTNGVIFVLDSRDRDRVGQAKDELQKLLQEDLLRDACLLVFANKQDLPSAMSTAEVID
eukprot:Hpha_TRINITY_DN16818_c0_g9::TRINITY_DN16818_c0_g9_i1::g.148353::m.148353/K07937/ARF1; ADP-ribosylation factor 1